VQEDDKVSVLGLGSLAPGKDVTVVFKHKDGSEDKIQAKHSMNHDQIEWFKAGSALNLMAKK
jgi:aconitate hydratase